MRALDLFVEVIEPVPEFLEAGRFRPARDWVR